MFGASPTLPCALRPLRHRHHPPTATVHTTATPTVDMARRVASALICWDFLSTAGSRTPQTVGFSLLGMIVSMMTATPIYSGDSYADDAAAPTNAGVASCVVDLVCTAAEEAVLVAPSGVGCARGGRAGRLC